MRKIDKLKKEAMESCVFRGHTMSKWSVCAPSERPRVVAYSECKRCGMTVVVDTRPPPNGIEVGGKAVAMHCFVLLHCITDDCPKDKKQVDLRVCSKCGEYSSAVQAGCVRCSHSEAKSDPKQERMEAIRASAGCQHILQCGDIRGRLPNAGRKDKK